MGELQLAEEKRGGNYEANIACIAIEVSVKAFWREAPFPSLRRRHFASSWALVLARQTLPSCLCANIEESTEAIIHSRGSSMWLSMFRSRVNTLSGVTFGV